MQSAFLFYCALAQLSRWFFKGTRSYLSHMGNYFDLVIIMVVGEIVILSCCRWWGCC